MSNQRTAVITGAHGNWAPFIIRELEKSGWAVLSVPPGIDVSNRDSMDEYLARAGLKKIDLLVNFAGGYLKRDRFENLEVTDFRDQYIRNVLTAVVATQAALRYMDRSGSVELVGGVGQVNGFVQPIEPEHIGEGAYRGAKAALEAIFATLQAEHNAGLNVPRASFRAPYEAVDTDAKRQTEAELYVSAVIEDFERDQGIGVG